MKSNTVPYSCHTFIYPFVYSTAKKEVSMDGFQKSVEAVVIAPAPGAGNDPVKAWEITDDHGGTGREGALSDELAYQRYQYFSGAARKAVLGEEPRICVNYRRKDVHEKAASYIIRKGSDCFSLNISDIVLKIFNTGVAMLEYRTEYLEEGRYESEKSMKLSSNISPDELRKNIKKINGYGRRLYPEYLPAGECDICPDRLEISIGGAVYAAESFADRTNESYLGRPDRLPSIITDILGLSEEDAITPAIDDRMFVCCCIMDHDYANHFFGYDPKAAGAERHQLHELAFRTDYNIGCELYALCNIDAADSSCRDREMLDECFDSQLYMRWLENGTLYAVTNHSMVCLTGAPGESADRVVKPFLLLYTEMCCLTLAQRATLLQMDDRITAAAAAVIDEADSGKWEKVTELEKKFALFQGQLMLGEITPQIQGIELYTKLQKMMFVEELENDVQRELNNLYEIAEAETARAESKAAREEEKRNRRFEGFFTSIGILTIFSALIDAFSFFKESNTILSLHRTELFTWWNTLIVIAAVVCFGLWRIIPHDKKKRKKKKTR